MLRNDLTIYERRASEWWDPASRHFRSLRSVNEARLGLLLEWLGGPSALRGATVVDLGCGGGFLAEPLAKLGARVIGCDLSGASLRAGRAHAQDGAATIIYAQADLRRAPMRDRCADLVLLADTIEHVEQPQAALAEAARLLKPGGRLYVNTISRTRRARFLAVTVAEGLGLLPKGTHDPRLFIKPGELVEMARGVGLDPVHLRGERLRLLKTVMTWTIHVKVAPPRITERARRAVESVQTAEAPTNAHARWWRLGILYSALFRPRGGGEGRGGSGAGVRATTA
jgi:2-polyprenyl-6-hydroxyphenyl methylase/3-demethylubiquinone-9 3-methyltransferase